eukprot:CAMPEP_0202697172 /NCGR_PEP_ID=MMETSP1385-20130828/10494_1 /ASSEMBLY_ACC=CAM_ASM_000861 /TAXON_ID=933848 /ORGANISM="Elphidium margaritaceum" /LENGTH=568 /DNA_ID=CAMNT_0049353551 /DNA_START=45 /DNA_END=1751 /DNA_ORIENTATION=-
MQTAQDSATSKSDLSSLLTQYGLHDAYHAKLVHQGFGSLELLAHVSEADVNQLCTQLEFPLVDKLRLKQALKSVNIPRDAVTYAIINQVEQMAIIDIHDSIKKAENLIVADNKEGGKHPQLEQALNAEKERVMAVFDDIRQKLNQKLQNVLSELEEKYETSKSYHQQLTKYLDDAKHIQQQCQQLIIDKTGFIHIDARNQSIINLKNECCAKLEQLMANKTQLSVCVDDAVMQQLVRTIEDVVQVQTLPQSSSSPPSSSQIRQPKTQLMQQSFSDSNVVQVHARGGGGGGGTHQETTTRVLKNKENVDALNSNQWVVNTATQTFANFGKKSTESSSEFGNIEWRYKFNSKPAGTTSAVSTSKTEPFGSFDKEPVFDIKASSSSNSVAISQAQTSALVASNAAAGPVKNEEENCSQITFKPIIALDERIVESGHEREELLRSFPVKSLYFWGKDVTGQNLWKLRAAQTELCFYLNKNTRKTRIICRECKTAKLRLNHYIPSPEISRLNCKNNRLVIWFAFDTTMAEDKDEQGEGAGAAATFCAKFNDAAAANEFVQHFEKYGGNSQAQN